MKRIFSLILAIALMTCTAQAAVLIEAPATIMKYDTVSVQAVQLDENGTVYDLEHLESDQLTSDLIIDAFDFVHEKQNRPVYWYPEDTQRQIAELGFDIEALSLTEIGRMHAPESDASADVKVNVQMKTAYFPGMPVVVVLGSTFEPVDPEWTALKTEVVATGNAEFTIPRELLASLQGNDFTFSLMCVLGRGTGTSHIEVIEEKDEHPSKSASSSTRIIETADGKGLSADFKLLITSENEFIRRELEDLREFVDDGRNAAEWLPAEEQNQIRCLLDGQLDSLIVSDYVVLRAEDYLSPTGDVIAAFEFAAPYQPGQQIVSALGLPSTDSTGDGTHMEWVVQPVIIRSEGMADVTFNRVAMDEMNTEKALLLIFTQPADQ